MRHCGRFRMLNGNFMTQASAEVCFCSACFASLIRQSLSTQTQTYIRLPAISVASVLTRIIHSPPKVTPGAPATFPSICIYFGDIVHQSRLHIFSHIAQTGNQRRCCRIQSPTSLVEIQHLPRIRARRFKQRPMTCRVLFVRISRGIAVGECVRDGWTACRDEVRPSLRQRRTHIRTDLC